MKIRGGRKWKKNHYLGSGNYSQEDPDALALKKGDNFLIFTVEGDHAILKPIKKKSLLDFYGTLPATRPYPGLEAIREEVHKKRAKRFNNEQTK